MSTVNHVPFRTSLVSILSLDQGTPGWATPRVLGRQLPLPPPPPPLGASDQQLVAKGVALRTPWAPKAPNAP